MELDQLNKQKFLIKSGVKINEPELLFSRIEDEQIENQLAKLKSKTKFYSHSIVTLLQSLMARVCEGKTEFTSFVLHFCFCNSLKFLM